MSRLTSFHKAMPEDIPRPVQLPASPPETELDQMIPHVHDHSVEAASETPASRFRRVVSTASYVHSSPARDPRPVGPRTSRWLVVVFPPQSLAREPAVLGHTLSTSAAGRFSNGILMPLFPTMYGQLTAIAREFGLPSVSGVCIYLHMTDGGLEMTPRVSDETWQMLWGHFFDDTALPQPGTGLPISGRIEFDIDIRKARWYQGWVGAARGELSVAPSVAPSAAYHRKRESRSTLFGDEDARSENGLFPLQLASSSRATVINKPQRLSLLQKNGDSTIAAQSNAQRDIIVLDDRSPPSDTEVIMSSKPLSPVPQEEEPATAKLVEVDRRVLQWRIASGSSPNPPSNKTGQISLDPAHLPNSAPDTPAEGKAPVDVSRASEAEDDGVELNLDDFDWSISSAGPRSYLDSPNWPEPLPSVQLEWRVQGSVPPSPSTVTTNWPYDYPDSPFSVASRLPSPDIAYRMMEDAPCTPTTATSWGPASYPASPVHSEYYPPSIDLVQRLGWSRPVTPSTATSWGPADLSYPPSPVPTQYPYTPDVADRAFDNEPRGQHPRAASFPYYSAWTREPWGYVWPYNQLVAPSESTSSMHQRAISSPEYNVGAREPWKQLWPYRQSTDVQGIRVDHLDYPFSQGVYRAVHSNVTVNVALPGFSGYPFANGIYPLHEIASDSISVVALEYPFTYGVYPLQASNLPQQVMLLGSSSYPFTGGIYPVTSASPVEVMLDETCGYPFNNGIYPILRSGLQVPSHNLVAVYPFIQESLYPAVYPYNLSSIYPQVGAQIEEILSTLPSKPCGIVEPSMYPFLEVYSTGYPHSLLHIYTAISKQPFTLTESVSVRIPLTYPALTPYDSVYPNFDIYPEPSAPNARIEHSGQWHRPITTKLTARWPALVVYSAQYPYFDIYPGAIPTSLTTPTTAALSSSAKPSPQHSPSLPVRLAPYYPAIEESLYPVGYPYSLDKIYPATHDAISRPATALLAAYPFVDGIYPAVYPHNMHSIYPAVNVPTFDAPFASGAYPFADGIYPAVYPYNLDCIYSKRAGVAMITHQVATLRYPFISGVYPAVYPHNISAIYPPVLTSRRSRPAGSSPTAVECRLATSYPYIQLYESRYPHVSPYPVAWISHYEERSGRSSSPGAVGRRSLTPSRHPVSRHRDGKTHAVRVSLSRQLSSELAPPVPPIPAHIRSPSTSPASSRPSSITIHEESASPPHRAQKTHKELHDRIFVDVGPSEDVLEISGILDRFPTPTASPGFRRTHIELHHLSPTSNVPSEEFSPAAGSSRAASQLDSSPTSFSPGHTTRTSLVLEKIKQFSPVDDNGSSPLSRSSSQSRSVSRLDRSKYPFV